MGILRDWVMGALWFLSGDSRVSKGVLKLRAREPVSRDSMLPSAPLPTPQGWPQGKTLSRLSHQGPRNREGQWWEER